MGVAAQPFCASTSRSCRRDGGNQVLALLPSVRGNEIRPPTSFQLLAEACCFPGFKKLPEESLLGPFCCDSLSQCRSTYAEAAEERVAVLVPLPGK